MPGDHRVKQEAEAVPDELVPRLRQDQEEDALRLLLRQPEEVPSRSPQVHSGQPTPQTFLKHLVYPWSHLDVMRPVTPPAGHRQQRGLRVRGGEAAAGHRQGLGHRQALGHPRGLGHHSDLSLNLRQLLKHALESEHFKSVFQFHIL